MAEHYGNGPFPLDFQIEECRFIRVFGRVGDFLVGCFWWGESMDEAVTVQAITWNLDGVYSKGEFPHMDLPPSPRVLEDRAQALRDKIASLEAEQARINQRLAEHPDAPEEWKRRDRERLVFNDGELRELRGRLEKLNPGQAVHEAAPMTLSPASDAQTGDEH